MASVQFYGQDRVIKAAENIKCPNWAIYSAKQFLFKYEGGDQEQSIELLTAILDNLKEADTVATYTIKFFESTDKINERSVCDGGSFNFKLTDGVKDYESKIESRGYPRGMGAVQRVIEDHVAKQVKEMLEGKPKELEYENKLGIIGEIMDHPTLGAILEKLALQWLSPANNPGVATPMTTNMRAVGNLASDTDLVKTLEALKQYDPQLTDHLKKLLTIAQNDPNTFQIFLGGLDKITST